MVLPVSGVVVERGGQRGGGVEVVAMRRVVVKGVVVVREGSVVSGVELGVGLGRAVGAAVESRSRLGVVPPSSVPDSAD